MPMLAFGSYLTLLVFFELLTSSNEKTEGVIEARKSGEDGKVRERF